MRLLRRLPFSLGDRSRDSSFVNHETHEGHEKIPRSVLGGPTTGYWNALAIKEEQSDFSCPSCVSWLIEFPILQVREWLPL